MKKIYGFGFFDLLQFLTIPLSIEKAIHHWYEQTDGRIFPLPSELLENFTKPLDPHIFHWLALQQTPKYREEFLRDGNHQIRLSRINKINTLRFPENNGGKVYRECF